MVFRTEPAIIPRFTLRRQTAVFVFCAETCNKCMQIKDMGTIAIKSIRRRRCGGRLWPRQTSAMPTTTNACPPRDLALVRHVASTGKVRVPVTRLLHASTFASTASVSLEGGDCKSARLCPQFTWAAIQVPQTGICATKPRSAKNPAYVGPQSIFDFAKSKPDRSTPNSSCKILNHLLCHPRTGQDRAEAWSPLTKTQYGGAVIAPFPGCTAPDGWYRISLSSSTGVVSPALSKNMAEARPSAPYSIATRLPLG